MPPFALSLYHFDNGRLVLHALPVMVGVLAVLAVAYRYYSAFLAAKVAALDDSRTTPAHRFHDGANYHPTNKWVLFGHHFAAISGAGPLIGPVLALQYGYLPGLIWLVVGVCLAGAVQDMLVLVVSTRTDGKSLGEIARRELGRPVSVVASLAILFIIVIALAGLGFVVVKALGGEEAKLPAGTRVELPAGDTALPAADGVTRFPPGCKVVYPPAGGPPPGPPTVLSQPFEGSVRAEGLRVRGPVPAPGSAVAPPPGGGRRPGQGAEQLTVGPDGPRPRLVPATATVVVLPAGCTQVIPGSSWGTFTIACTIPIALLIGAYLNKLRPGRVVEASLIGGAMTLGAVVLGGSVPGSPLEPYFRLSREQTVIALTAYGFVAAVLPVWLLLGPRDYLSSFLKVGTVGLLIVSVCVANPVLQAPLVNHTFADGGPTFRGNLFPFVFICIMCGAVSGFHALVSSGTTPKMVDRESHIRRIGYGAMLMEGVVAVTALIAAAALPPDLYYAMNVSIDDAPKWQAQVDQVVQRYGADPLVLANAGGLAHLDLGRVEQQVGGESLRGRTGGAVTLAVGMSVVFEDAFRWVGVKGDWLLKYWYHFAIMFEALFILTTIDAGTRIGRFLLQETAGRVYAPFARPDWRPGAILASAVITGGWGWLIHTGSIDTIWPMFGVANQLLAVLALTLVTTWLVNHGRGRWAWVTLLPLLWVTATTLTAGTQLVSGRFPDLIDRGRELGGPAGRRLVVTGYLNIGLTLFVLASVLAVLATAAARWVGVAAGWVKPTREA
jgi:carbon starvation protein